MARRIIINNILNLIKDIGGNPKNYMGTKTNINFLGKGPKESLFQGQIDIDGLMRSNFPIERVVSEAERAGGYVSANKLNDFQLQRLQDNLLQLKKAYFPEQIANITDLGTGTRNLTQEGLGSLRQGGDPTKYKIGDPITSENFGATGLAPDNAALRKARLQDIIDNKFGKGYFGSATDDLGAGETAGGLMGRISERMKNIKNLSDEMGAVGKGEPTKEMTFGILDPTAEKVSYASRFNPRNEVHVNKAKALLEDPQIKGLYTEAEVKNAFDFEGLYQAHFDKGHVDVAMLFEQAGHNIPLMRASARDALLTLMKKQGQKGTGLRDFVDEVDFQYITEGGGGRAGDPINLFVKYFGKNAAENLPKTATKENINIFTDFIVNARDRRGRGIDDPFFDRETIDFSALKGIVDDLPPFKTGGRVGFKWGSGLSKTLLRKINKKMIKDAVDDIFPTGDYKMDAEIAAEALVENNPRLFGGKLIDDLDGAARSDIYGLVLGEVQTRFGLQVKKNMGIKDLIKNVDEQFGEGTLKRASELPQGTKYSELEAIKDFEARNRTFLPNREKIRAYYQGKIDDDLLDQILADNNPQRIAEVLATIDEALLMQGRGIGPETIMQSLKDSWGRKPSASGGLAKILEV
tara:strand:+ start:3882 stop:5786 length:1905 start_codon:yes stop_codon:yes gene_type:complete